MASEKKYKKGTSTDHHGSVIYDTSDGRIITFAGWHMNEMQAVSIAELLNSASSAAADEVGRLRERCRVLAREVAAWRERQDWAVNVRPGESPEADSTILRTIDEVLAARTATDASGAMHTPTTGGQGEGGKHEND